MNCERLYFHPTRNLLLDVGKGIFNYDADTHTMILIEHIRKREQRVLACLLAYENTPVSRVLLASQAWAGRIVSDNAVSVAINTLRKILVTIDPHCCCLMTVRNTGYVFSPGQSGLIPVESLDFLLASLRWSSIPRTAETVAYSHVSPSTIAM